jgi:hypothetical protein
MKSTQTTSPRFVSVVVAVNGLGNLIAGAIMIVAPAWFFEYIGDFPPFSRHYVGDAGAFNFGIGLALILAVRNPIRHRALILAGTVANVLHTANHLYDDALAGGLSSSHLVSQTLPLVLLTLALVWAYLMSMHQADTANFGTTSA